MDFRCWRARAADAPGTAPIIRRDVGSFLATMVTARGRSRRRGVVSRFVSLVYVISDIGYDESCSNSGAWEARGGRAAVADRGGAVPPPGSFPRW